MLQFPSADRRTERASRVLKVLIADDDPTTRTLLKWLLTRDFDCAVTAVENGLEALARLDEDCYSVLLLDVHMPVMGGLETLEAIRGSAYGSLPVVMLTADRGEAVVSRAVALGITDYLTKPISPKTTGERLGQVLHSLESDPGGQAGADDGQATIDGHVAVVVAEGDPVYRQFLMDFFTPRCATLLAPSGAEALAQCLRAAPRLVWAASTTHFRPH